MAGNVTVPDAGVKQMQDMAKMLMESSFGPMLKKISQFLEGMGVHLKDALGETVPANPTPGAQLNVAAPAQNKEAAQTGTGR